MMFNIEMKMKDGSVLMFSRVFDLSMNTEYMFFNSDDGEFNFKTEEIDYYGVF